MKTQTCLLYQYNFPILFLNCNFCEVQDVHEDNFTYLCHIKYNILYSAFHNIKLKLSINKLEFHLYIKILNGIT
ncbi:hypothetical protein L1887_09040 [Cichorium endivia]|nr:hypothetical protein L1887_09040 [Cichorium endivia]